MANISLYKHQKEALDRTKDLSNVAYYHDMGLGKTFTGSEKMRLFATKTNLVICQKSKVNDWIEHFKTYYPLYYIYDLTDKYGLNWFNNIADVHKIGIINYELAFRRPELLELKDFTLILDESSLIQNVKAKRTKFVMKLTPKHIILLSGTPTGGKYENLLSQMNLLGWKISESVFWNQYVNWEWNETDDGFWQKKILGYKNEERLKRKMRQHGCDFLKTNEVFDLPDQIDQNLYSRLTKEYLKFKKNNYIEIDGNELEGDTILKQMLYERQLCGCYHSEKVERVKDLLESTEDRIIIFYNFNAELDILKHVSDELGRESSIVNGQIKDLYAYENINDSVTFIQYQAGSMGLNLQKANKIIYFTPPLSSELFEQSKKRIHRIGQSKTCFYYYLICKKSIEEKIYRTLAMRKDYTEELFKEDK